MATIAFMPFQNDTESFKVGTLTIKNDFNEISINGSVNITKDKIGYKNALFLKRLIDGALDEMKRDKNLPEKIEFV